MRTTFYPEFIKWILISTLAICTIAVPQEEDYESDDDGDGDLGLGPPENIAERTTFGPEKKVST